MTVGVPETPDKTARETHDRKWTSIVDQWTAQTNCECGWAAAWDIRTPRPAEAWHKWHLAQVAEQVRRQHIAWYRATGHCGACGQPGVFCLCTTPCGCAGLHECGSGVVADAAAVFADQVAVDQAELFPDLAGEQP